MRVVQAWAGSKVKPEQVFPMLRHWLGSDDEDVDPVESAHAVMAAMGGPTGLLET